MHANKQINRYPVYCLCVTPYRERLSGGKQKQVIVEGELQTLRGYERDDEDVVGMSITQFSPAYRSTSTDCSTSRKLPNSRANNQQPFK